jgi:predicted phosphodiesterase
VRGSDRIIHAGDVGSPEILEKLSAIAPVIAVRGNIDKAARAGCLPETEVLELGGRIDLRSSRSCSIGP